MLRCDPFTDMPGAPPVLLWFLVMDRSHSNKDQHLKGMDGPCSKEPSKIYLKVYLRVVVKLKTSAREGKGIERNIRRAQRKHQRYSLPHSHRSASSTRAVPHPHLTTKATLQTPTPIPEGNFGYL